MKKIFSTLVAVALAAFTFTSCEDIPAPYNLPGEGNPDGPVTEVTPEGDGTQANPFNVAAVNEECAKLEQGATSSQTYYFTGKVVSFKSGEEPGNSYGNSTFYISDDGTSTKQFYVYRCFAGPNNKKFTSADELQIGDLVTICAKLTNYNGTLETAQNSAYVVKVVRNGETISGSDTPATPDTPATGEAKGDGTQTNPYNPVGANAFASKLAADTNSDPIYIKGKISNIKEKPSSQYGNATFYISEDGTGNNEFYVFRCYNLGNVKFTDADANSIKVGDEVVIYGPVVNYKGNTPETVQNKAYIYSLNGKTEGGSSSEPSTPSTPTTGGEGVAIDGTNVTLTNSSATASATTTTLDLSTLGFENGVAVTTVNFPDGATATFDANGETNAPKYYTATNGVRVYKNNTITLNGKQKIAKVVFTCDSYQGTNYVGNNTATVTFSGNGAVYTNVFTEATGGGVQLRVKTITIYYAN